MSDGEDHLEISSAVVPCIDRDQPHFVDRESLACTRCSKRVTDLRCPTHDKVYSHHVDIDQVGAIVRKWICRVCLAEGTEPFPDAREYQILLGRKLSAPRRGGPVEDSPRPDMAAEYPRQGR